MQLVGVCMKTSPMKKQLLLITTVLSSLASFAQSETELSNWQSQHPDKLIMSRANFERLDASLREIISSTVVFVDEIGFDLKSIEANQTESTDTAMQSDADFIKVWLGKNPDVKIVTRSQYESSRPVVQEIYNSTSIMVLLGEEITKEDILNY